MFKPLSSQLKQKGMNVEYMQVERFKDPRYSRLHVVIAEVVDSVNIRRKQIWKTKEWDNKGEKSHFNSWYVITYLQSSSDH